MEIDPETCSWPLACPRLALHDKYIPRRVGAVRQPPVDHAPWPRAVRQVQDLADLRFKHWVCRAVSAHELGGVELADLAFANAPHQARHVPMLVPAD